MAKSNDGKDRRDNPTRCRMPEWFPPFAEQIRQMGPKALEAAIGSPEDLASDGDRKYARIASDVPETLEEALKFWEVDTELWRVDKVRFNIWGKNQQARLDLVPQTPNRQQFLEALTERLEAHSRKSVDVQTPTEESLALKPYTAVVSDLHYGAKPKPSTLNRPYDVTVLASMLRRCAQKINRTANGRPVILVSLGDLIESFTGLNHPGSWKELSHYGMDALIGVFELFETELIARIKNLLVIHSVPGNHDRVTSNNKLDYEREGGKFFYWAVKRLYPDLAGEYDPIAISFVVGEVCYICWHGEHNHGKAPATDIIMRYSADKNAKYHILLQGHLHSHQQTRKALAHGSVVVEEDGVYMRKVTCPSFFPGNFYSEALGFTSRPAYLMIGEDENGRVDYLDLEL